MGSKSTSALNFPSVFLDRQATHSFHDGSTLEMMLGKHVRALQLSRECESRMHINSEGGEPTWKRRATATRADLMSKETLTPPHKECSTHT